MLNQTHLFALLGGLLLIAFVSNRLFRRSGVPDLIVLMLVGVLLGPILHVVNGIQFQIFTQYLGTLALILILFESGSELQIRGAVRYFPIGILLAIAGYGLSFFAAAFAAGLALGLPLSSSVLVGAVLGCTSGTMVLPALQQIEPEEHVRVVLLIEAALGDIIAVVTVGSLVGVAEGDLLITSVARSFLLRILISTLFPFAVGYIWTRLQTRLVHVRFSNVATLGAILTLYSGTRLLGGSGLLAVLVFGLVQGNTPTVVHTEPPRRLLGFHSDLSFLVRSFFFVLLGIQVQPIDRRLQIAVAAIVFALLAARLAAVQVIRIAGLKPADRELIFWLMPRGLVTAVLALRVAQVVGARFSFLPEMAFAVILATNIFLLIGAARNRARSTTQLKPGAAPSGQPTD
jgi:potassium/hydrogen antiporter